MIGVLGDAAVLLAALFAVAGLGILFLRSASAAVWSLVVVVVLTQAIVPPLELQVTFGNRPFTRSISLQC